MSEEQQVKLQDHLAKHNSSEEQRAKARERMLKLNVQKGIQVEVTVVVTNVTTTYDSIRKAAEAINTDHKSLLYNEKTKKPFKGKYMVKFLRHM